MDEIGLAAQEFEAHRAHLRAVAYRMLGSHAEADDAVQEAWVRASRADATVVENLGGWLTRSTDAARQLASRARRRVQGGSLTPTSDADRVRQREVVDAFFAAARGGDLEALVAVLDPDVVLRSDRGGLPGKSTIVRGAHAVASQAILFSNPSLTLEPVLVNGGVGVVVRAGTRPVAVMGFTVLDGRVVAIEALSDRGRVGRLDLP